MKNTRSILLCVIAAAVLCAGTVSAKPADKSVPKPVTVTSYKKHFTVTAATHQLANSIASDSEEARGYILEKLGWEQVWRHPIGIIIADKDAKFRRKIVFNGEDIEYAVVVPETGEYFLNTVIPEIIRYVLISQSRVRKDTSIDQIYDHIPYWLMKGVTYYSDPRREPLYANETRSALFRGTSFPVGHLFGVRGRLGDEKRDHLFGCESAALVDYLITRERGRERFRAFVSSLNDDEGWKCIFEDIYAGDFRNDAELQAAFLGSLRNPNRISVNMPRMNLPDSLALLGDALAVKARSAAGAAEEAGGVAALTRFKPCCKQEIARRKLMQAYPALIKIKFEGAQELQGVVEKYLQAYILSGQKDRKKFWQSFVDAENARRKIETAAAADGGNGI